MGRGAVALLSGRGDRAVLFDLDDTIVDFTGNQEAAWREASRWAAERLPGLDAEAFARAAIATSAWFWSDARRHLEGRRDLRAASAQVARLAIERLGTPAAPPALPVEIAHRYRDLRDAGLALVPGAVALLESLRAAGAALALVTNGTAAEQRAKLERFDLARRFDHLQIEGEFGAGKPEVAVYEATLRALGVAAAEATFVGDHLEWDVTAPMRLGMAAVWIDVGGRGLPHSHEARPARIVRTVAELLPATRRASR